MSENMSREEAAARLGLNMAELTAIEKETNIAYGALAPTELIEHQEDEGLKKIRERGYTMDTLRDMALLANLSIRSLHEVLNGQLRPSKVVEAQEDDDLYIPGKTENANNEIYFPAEDTSSTAKQIGGEDDEDDIFP